MTEETKKVQLTTEQKIEKLLKESYEVLEIFKGMFKKTASLHAKIEKEMKSMKKEHTHLVGLIGKKFDNQNNSISKCAEIAENSEDTLLNVLLAIRQNEYLQAYYPAQNGTPEMKVIGSHPCKYKETEVLSN